MNGPPGNGNGRPIGTTTQPAAAKPQTTTIVTPDRPTVADVITYYAETIPVRSVHPAAEAWPMASDDEFKALVDDVAARGLVVPILVTADGVLVDGRNRLAACYAASVDPRFEVCRAPDLWNRVHSLNATRRHLTTGQLAMVALEYEKHYAVEADDRKRAGVAPAPDLRASRPKGVDAPRARDLAAAKMGTSGRSVARAKKVTEAAPELAEQVKAGTLALDAAEKEVKERRPKIVPTPNLNPKVGAANRRKHAQILTAVTAQLAGSCIALAEIKELDNTVDSETANLIGRDLWSSLQEFDRLMPLLKARVNSTEAPTPTPDRPEDGTWTAAVATTFEGLERLVSYLVAMVAEGLTDEMNDVTAGDADEVLLGWIDAIQFVRDAVADKTEPAKPDGAA